MQNSTKKKRSKRDRVLVWYVQCHAESVQEAARTVGWRTAKKGNHDWDLAWGDTTAALFREVTHVKSFQRVNHFPLMQLICRKDLLAQHLRAMQQACTDSARREFDFFPHTWIFPGDTQRFWTEVHQAFARQERSLPPDVRKQRARRLKKQQRKANRSKQCDMGSFSSSSEDELEPITFIAKPRSLARGVGIFLFQIRPEDLRKEKSQALKQILDGQEKLVVQRFLTRPHTIDGYKWDMRVYVLVTNVDPLTVFLYTDGLGRFCTEPYEEPDEDNLDEREMHLTNFSINFESENFEDTEDGSTGSKRSLRSVLENEVDDGRKVWVSIVSCVRRTLMAIAPKMKENYYLHFGHTRLGSHIEVGATGADVTQNSASGASCACFELLGFDFMLDEDQKLFLLEVNSAPSLATPTALDEEIKEGVLCEAFRLLQLDATSKSRHRKLRAQQLLERSSEHVSRHGELVKQRDERLRGKVGFLSSLGHAVTDTSKAIFRSGPSGSDKKESGGIVEDGSNRQNMPVRAGGSNDVSSYPKQSPFASKHEREYDENMSNGSDDGSDDEEDGDCDASDSDSDSSSESVDDCDEWMESDNAFSFLGPAVSKNYIQILPMEKGSDGPVEAEIEAAAVALAKGWNVGAAKVRSSPSLVGPSDTLPSGISSWQLSVSKVKERSRSMGQPSVGKVEERSGSMGSTTQRPGSLRSTTQSRGLSPGLLRRASASPGVTQYARDLREQINPPLLLPPCPKPKRSLTLKTVQIGFD